jgi:hypothetical protein
MGSWVTRLARWNEGIRFGDSCGSNMVVVGWDFSLDINAGQGGATVEEGPTFGKVLLAEGCSSERKTQTRNGGVGSMIIYLKFFYFITPSHHKLTPLQAPSKHGDS